MQQEFVDNGTASVPAIADPKKTSSVERAGLWPECVRQACAFAFWVEECVC